MFFSLRCLNKFRRSLNRSVMKYFLALSLCLFMLLWNRSNDENFQDKNTNLALIQVRENLLRLTVWPSADQMPLLIDETQQHLSSFDFQAGQWPDLNYSTDSLENCHLSEHLIRLRMFSIVYSFPNRLIKDKRLIQAIRSGLRTWLKHDWQRPSWWWNRIPDVIIGSEILLILGNKELSEQEIDGIFDLEVRLSRGTKYLTDHYDSPWGIQSRVYSLLGTSGWADADRTLRTLLRRVRLQRRFASGLQTDLSTSFKAPLSLQSVFQDKWTETNLHMILATNGTKYALEPKYRDVFAQFLVENDAWLTKGPVWTWGVLGRLNVTGIKYFYPYFLQPEHVRLFANIVTNKRFVSSLNDYADRLENKFDAAPLVGNQHFHIGNIHIHRRMNWIASLKLNYNQRQDLSCFDSENLRNTHIEDGVLYLSTPEGQTNGNEDHQTIFKVLGRVDIRGSRSERFSFILGCSMNLTLVYVPQMIGGVTDSMYGIAWMGTPIAGIIAKRSWHFYDDFILVLADGHVYRSGRQLETSLASLILPSEQTKEGQITIQWQNGSRTQLHSGDFQFNRTKNRIVWFHAANTAWILLDDYELLRMSCHNQGSETNNIGPWNFQMHDRIFNAKIVPLQHVEQTIFNSRYVVIPNVTVQSIPKIWKENNSMINNTQMTVAMGKTINETLFIHGSCDPTIQRASVVVFRKPSRYSIDSYYNCSSLDLSLYIKQDGGILFKEDADTFTLTVSQPIISTRYFIVDINRASLTSNICTRTLRWTPQSGTRVTIQMPQNDELKGKSVSVTCKKRFP